MGIERVSVNDLTTLATDHGQVPMNIGAVLTLTGVVDPAQVVAELGGRLAAIPRFRQRLIRPGFAAGRPLWADDPHFDPAQHVRGLDGEPADLVCSRLPQDRPLWALGWSSREPGEIEVVLVVHHVLADGMGGLAVLAALADGMPPMTAEQSGPVPSRQALVADAMRQRWHSLPRTAATARQAWRGLGELGVFQRRPEPAALTSLNRPTSSRRRVRVVRRPLAQIIAAGQPDATVNDVVLAAISQALFDLLARRGEHPGELVISVPISMRSTASTDHLGNEVGAVPIVVRPEPDPAIRLGAIATGTRAAKGEQRGQSALVLSWLFRGLARVHLVQHFLDRQRLVHSFETNLRGPSQRVRMAGCDVVGIVPIAVNPGNVGVSFDVLTYAGEFVIAIVADPVLVPDLDSLADLVSAQLDALCT